MDGLGDRRDVWLIFGRGVYGTSRGESPIHSQLLSIEPTHCIIGFLRISILPLLSSTYDSVDHGKRNSEIECVKDAGLSLVSQDSCS